MTDYQLFILWICLFGGPALFAYGIYLLVRGGTRSPSAHNDNDDSEIWGDASLYRTESRHE